MTKNDADKFTEILTGVAEVFGEPVSMPRFKAYFAALSDLSIEQVEEAATRLMNSCKFFPKPVEFREVLSGTSADQAEQAWRTFVELSRFESGYPSLQVTDGPLAFAIEHLGGWISATAKLNAASVEMAASYAKEFKASYKLGQWRNAEPKYLVGQFEAGNRGGNFERAKGNEIELSVCVVSLAGYQSYRLPFDLTTGQLTESAKAALSAGNDALRYFLPMPARPALPPAPDSEMATPEEVQQLKASIRSLTAQVVNIADRRSS